MTTELIKALIGAAGATGDKTYVDDVFSMLTKVAPGGTNAVFDVGIDFAKRGGMFWAKQVTGTRDWKAHDTERGTNSELTINLNTAADVLGSGNTYITSWNNNGYTISSDWSGINKDPYVHIWFNFAKQEKFLDIVTYTGTGSARTIAHSLGSVPGAIFIKQLNATGDWYAYHREMQSSDPAEKVMYPNTSNNAQTSSGAFNDTEPTSTVFSVGNLGDTNGNGDTFVAYLFAHNDGDGEFGEEGDQDIIKCGSYTGNGNATGPVVNLGWEPQFIIFKDATTDGEDWMVFNSLRGISSDNDEQKLILNDDVAEVASTTFFDLTATGFKITTSNNAINKNNDRYVYIAIRMSDGSVGKPAEAGTDVFAMSAPTSGNNPEFASTFPVDYGIYKKPASVQHWFNSARLIGPDELKLDTNEAESAWAAGIDFQHNNGWGGTSAFGSANDYQSWMWKRHAGFDVVTYKGTGSNQTIAHSLGVAPQMVWVKCRTSDQNSGATAVWLVWHESFTSGSYSNIPNTNNFMELDTTEPVGTGTYFNSTAPTSSVVSLGTTSSKWDVRQNQSGESYLMLLFASVTGICKVGTYTGDGQTEQDISLGFQPRFLIIRKFDGSANWVVFDTVRGWTNSSNEVLLLHNSNAEAELTGTDMYTKPTSTGFKAMGDWADSNNNNSKYIYYAHA